MADPMNFSIDYGKIKDMCFTYSAAMVEKKVERKPRVIYFYCVEELAKTARFISENNPWSHGYESTYNLMKETMERLVGEYLKTSNCYSITTGGFRVEIEDEWKDDGVQHYRIGFLAQCHYDLDGEDKMVEVY